MSANVAVANVAKTYYKFISVNDLRLGKYQRVITDMARIKKMSDVFDETLLGTITVSFRDGKNYVIDGQHRTVLSKIMKREGLMALVYEGLTYEQEAEYFNKLNGANGEQKKLRKSEVFNANVEAKDAMSIDIQAIIEELGFYLSATSGDNSIAAIGTVEKIYKKRGSQGLKEVLQLTRDTWNGEKYSLNNQVLDGISEFLNIYRGDINFSNKTFIRQLSKIDPLKIVREAKNDTSTSKGTVKMMNTLLKYYNVRMQKKLINQHYLLG